MRDKDIGFHVGGTDFVFKAPQPGDGPGRRILVRAAGARRFVETNPRRRALVDDNGKLVGFFVAARSRGDFRPVERAAGGWA